MLGHTSCSDSDFIFKFENTSYTCAKSVFSSASPLLKEIFECDEKGAQIKTYPGLEIKKCSHPKRLLLTMDASMDAFSVIYRFLHNEKIGNVDFLLPQVCLLAKSLKCNEAWRFFMTELVKSISLQNIGEICALAFLGSKEVMSDTEEEESVEVALADATRKFLLANADALACSQTGQLSARIYVDVLCHENNQQQQDDDDDGLKLVFSDWDLNERILQVCRRRLHYMEPLDDKSRSRKLTNRAHAMAKDTVTEEIRLTINESQLQGFAKQAISQSSLSSATGTSCEGEREDDETDSVLDRCGSNLSNDSTNSLPPATSPDAETCLLARTTLGFGSISIHLGKLEGRLVSLSVKRKPMVASPSSSFANSVPFRGLTGPSPHDFHSLDHAGKQSPCSQRCSSGCLRNRLSVPRAAAGAVCLPEDVSEGETALVLLSGGYTQDGCLKSVELLHLSTELVEQNNSDYRLSASSSLGYGTESECTSPIGMEGDLSQHGPPMHCARGRLAVALAHTPLPTVFACGGSDGSKDLDSVECLSIDNLTSGWRAQFRSQTFSNSDLRDSRPTVDVATSNSLIELGGGVTWQFVANLHQARSCCSAAVLDQSKIVVLGGQFAGHPLSTVETYEPVRNEWLNLPSMIEARNHLCSAALSSRGLIFAVGGISEFVEGQESSFALTSLSLSPSSTPTQALLKSNLYHLSTTAEVLDYRTSRWIRFPEPISLSPLIGSTLVPLDSSADRLLLIGGFDGQSTLAQTHIFDLRTWSWFSGPTLQIGRSNPSAVPLSSSTLAILGGYNMAMGGFLDSVEVIASPTPTSL